jgi:hypothetical protein
MALEQWRKGLLRLYVVLAVPWALWFGYAVFQDDRVYSYNREYVEAFDRNPGKDWTYYHRAAGYRDEYLNRRNENLIWLAIIPIGYPITALALLWVVAGFRRH